jgi:hypothetical protein
VSRPLAASAVVGMQLFARGLATEAVEGFSTALEGVDNVHGVHSLAAGMLSVGDGVSQGVFQKHFHDRANFFGDECVDALDTTTTSETADGGLGDTLDFVAKHPFVAFGPALAQSFATLPASRHCVGDEWSIKCLSTKGRNSV